MTVAFDVGPLRANPAGVGVYVRSLAQGLAEIGQSDLVYIGRRSDAEGLPEGVPSIPRGNLPYPVWVQLQAARSARRSGAAIAHFTDGLVPPIRSRPTIVSVMDLSLVRQWRTHRAVRYARIPLVLAAPRLAQAVIAISKATADEVIRLTHTPARRIHVVPLAPRASAQPASDATIAETMATFDLDRGGFLLVPGTLEPRKNHVRVIAAFEQLARQSSLPDGMQLVLAGGRGWKAAGTLAAIADSPVRDRIRWLGYVPEEQMAALMTAAAAVVYASTYEGFGMPVLEAMACGAVVVTSNVSSMPEAAGGEGILVDPYSIESIASGIVESLTADEAARDRAIARARRDTWTRVAEQTASIYDQIA